MKPFKFITSITILTFALVTTAFADGHAMKKDIVDTAAPKLSVLISKLATALFMLLTALFYLNK